MDIQLKKIGKKLSAVSLATVFSVISMMSVGAVKENRASNSQNVAETSVIQDAGWLFGIVGGVYAAARVGKTIYDSVKNRNDDEILVIPAEDKATVELALKNVVSEYDNEKGLEEKKKNASTDEARKEVKKLEDNLKKEKEENVIKEKEVMEKANDVEKKKLTEMKKLKEKLHQKMIKKQPITILLSPSVKSSSSSSSSSSSFSYCNKYDVDGKINVGQYSHIVNNYVWKNSDLEDFSSSALDRLVPGYKEIKAPKFIHAKDKKVYNELRELSAGFNNDINFGSYYSY